jgi:hypothetical protein
VAPHRAANVAALAPDLARQDEGLRSRLGLGWSQIRAAGRHAAPYRSVLGDTLLEVLTD